MTVVGDTSVLRYLVSLGQVDLLPRRFGQLLIPPEVADECRHSGSPESLRAFIGNPPGWLSIDPISASAVASAPGVERLDPGEAAAIRLALLSGDRERKSDRNEHDRQKICRLHDSVQHEMTIDDPPRWRYERGEGRYKHLPD